MPDMLHYLLIRESGAGCALLEDPDLEKVKISLIGGLKWFRFPMEYGVPKERMSWKGYSNTQMKFPTTSLEREMAENRRVKIKVVE